MLTDRATETLSQLATVGSTALLWLWSSLGRKNVGEAALQRLLSQRFQAATAAFLPLMLIAGCASWLSKLSHPGIIGLLAALIFCLREALDPMRPILWHHKRLRPITILGTLSVGMCISTILPTPEWAVLTIAVAAFHRHTEGTINLFRQSLVDSEALASKVRALDTARRLEQALIIEAKMVEPKPIRSESTRRSLT